MRARSALFELYGDHLRTRGAAAPVAAIVRLLEPLDIAAPAVRTAISRMVREGWLDPAQLPDGRGYVLTPYAKSWLEDAAIRVYRSQALPTWDGRWHIVTTGPLAHRSARQRLRSGMAFIGYAPLDESTWISPRVHPDVQELLEAAGVPAESFHAEHQGDSARLVARAWDIDALATAYEVWRCSATELVHSAGDEPDDRTAYAVRCHLVHEWRLFLFRDPDLPRALLPASWPGDDAAAYFREQSTRLLPAAQRHVDRCLPTRPHPDAYAPAPGAATRRFPLSDTVLYETSGAVATITLNRPEALNAATVALKTALLAALAAAHDDAGVRAVVLTGAGRAFCAGQDLQEHGDLLAAGGELTTVRDHYNPITLALATMPKPVVAAVNGVAAGAGASFALACDFRLVAATASFRLAFASVGLGPDGGASWTLQRLVGFGRATALLMLGEPITPEHALEMGMVNAVLPHDQVLSVAQELAARLAQGPTLAFAATKAALAAAAGGSLADALEVEERLQRELGLTSDHFNATTAFLSKQTPEFEGR